MKKISALLTILILVGIFVPAVSAEEIYNQTYSLEQFIDYSKSFTEEGVGTTQGTEYILLYRGNDFQGVKVLSIIGQFDNQVKESGSAADSCVFKYNGNIIGTGECGHFYYKVGDENWLQEWITFDYLDVPASSGKVVIQVETVNDPINSILPKIHGYANYEPSGEPHACFCSNYLGQPITTPDGNAIYTITTSMEWSATLTVDNLGSYSDVQLISNKGLSKIAVTKAADDTLIYAKTDVLSDTTGVYNGLFPIITNVSPMSVNHPFIATIYLEDSPIITPPDNASVTVYVRNSQTGALLADAHIVINASVNNEFFEVVNESLPSGIYIGNLQPTGGGLPNPDFYRLIATAEGYNSIMPYIDFEVDGATTLYAYLDPIGGAPEDENKTFIDFYVRDLNANPISGATVKFGDYTLITNSAGYTIFEVEKDSTYTWTVSKSGYGSVTGNAVIGSDARHTINAVIAPAVTPTTTTPIPTSIPGSPTPTMTAPTGEPVSNLLEWFAAHFGMLLGGSVEIGKIFMWLCFSVPIGVYVGKEAKSGAAGFMAGAGIVTLFFVLIGWVPIWLVVLLALIIGLLYAKVFSNTDNGGGR